MADAEKFDYVVSAKIVFVGPDGAGKTSMIMKHVHKSFVQEEWEVRQVYDNFTTRVVKENTAFYLDIWDTAGSDEYDRLRPLSYPNTSLFLLCFPLGGDIDNEQIEKWSLELNHFASDAKIVLVGCKSDLLVDDNARQASLQMGQKIAMVSEFHGYTECSAKSGEGVEDVFDLAMQILMDERRKRSDKDDTKSTLCAII